MYFSLSRISFFSPRQDGHPPLDDKVGRLEGKLQNKVRKGWLLTCAGTHELAIHINANLNSKRRKILTKLFPSLAC